MEIETEEKPPGTLFVRETDIGNYFKKPELFFKYEGYNPTGTQKDRISEKHVKNALSQGYDTISVTTCGNYGVSIAYYARKYGLKAIIGIPSEYSGGRRNEILEYGATIMEQPVKYEEMVELMRHEAEVHSWYDASPGSINSYMDYESYSNIAYEIYNSLENIPNYVSVPVGNGTTLYGIYLGFENLYKNHLIDKIPKFIANSTINGNPVIHSFLNGFKKIHDLNPDSIMETPVNEPLVAFRSYDGQKALDVLYETRGYALYSTDDELKKLSSILMKYDKLSVLPASCSALSGALRVINNERCVVILTGRY